MCYSICDTHVCSPAGDVPNDCTLHAGALVGRSGIDKYANDGFWRVLQRWTMRTVQRSHRASWHRLCICLVRFRWVLNIIAIDKSLNVSRLPYRNLNAVKPWLLEPFSLEPSIINRFTRKLKKDLYLVMIILCTTCVQKLVSKLYYIQLSYWFSFFLFKLLQRYFIIWRKVKIDWFIL